MRKVASVTDIYQVELALVVVVSCFSRPSVLRYEHICFFLVDQDTLLLLAVYEDPAEKF